MRGTIEQITTKTGSNSKGPWKKWGVKIDTGQWLSTFDKDIGDSLKEGQTYDFEVERKGDFLTITEAVRVKPGKDEQEPWPGEEPAKPEKIAPAQNGNKPFMTDTEQFLAKQRSITWSVAIERATALELGLMEKVALPPEQVKFDWNTIIDRILAHTRKFYAEGKKVLEG